MPEKVGKSYLIGIILSLTSLQQLSSLCVIWRIKAYGGGERVGARFAITLS
jgi:hypothetical protein